MRRPKSIAGLLFAVVRIYAARAPRRALGAVALALLAAFAVTVRCSTPPAAAARRANAFADVGIAFSPSIAWNGAGYGVAWVDLRDRRAEIYFARLSAAGAKLGEDVRVTASPSVKGAPHLVWTGREYAVTWTDVNRDGEIDVYLARVSSGGAPVGEPTRVSRSDARDFGARVAWSGREYGVAWLSVASRTEFGVRFARVSAAGARVGDEVAVRRGAIVTGAPDVAWGDGEYGVAWNEFRAQSGASATMVARVSAAGAPRAPSAVSSHAGLSLGQSIAADGDTFGVAWQDGVTLEKGTLCFATSSASGSGSGRVPVSDGHAHAGSPSVAFADDGYGLAWQDARNGPADVYFTRLTRGGALRGRPLRVTAGAGTAQAPSLAWTGTEYGLVWAQLHASGLAVHFARVTASGERAGDDVRVTATYGE